MRELLILPQYQRFIKFPLHRPITSTTNGLEKKKKRGGGIWIYNTSKGWVRFSKDCSCKKHNQMNGESEKKCKKRIRVFLLFREEVDAYLVLEKTPIPC